MILGDLRSTYLNKTNVIIRLEARGQLRYLAACEKEMHRKCKKKQVDNGFCNSYLSLHHCSSRTKCNTAVPL